MSMYENVGMTSLDYMEEILQLRKALADVADECSKAYDKIAQLENPWVSVEDRLPEIPKPDEGYCCFLVSDGSLIHMAYYTEDGWLFADCGEMKEMFYKVTHWCYLPDYPNHRKENEDVLFIKVRDERENT